MTGGYRLEFEDDFAGGALDERRWLPYYLPQWSSRERTRARHELRDGALRLLIEEGQGPWCPEFDGEVRVSSLQTGVFAGPVGSAVGQQRFNPELVVREAQENVRLYTPRYGRVEVRLKALDDPLNMVALWMIGYEDRPERSAEICVCEIFGRDVRAGEAAVGMGVHPFGDPDIIDDFEAVRLPIDAREFHVYAAESTAEQVAFFVDGEQVKVVDQSPAYRMQLMLSVYEFPAEGVVSTTPYPKRFTVDYVRGYAPSLTSRLATRDDVPALEELMRASIDELQRPYLDEAQIRSSHAIMGIDNQLIDDGTYFVVECEGRIAGCGGWSRRATLYGGDRSAGRDSAMLDPGRDPARVRAMYTHPDFTRRGVGRLVLELCEAAAGAEGFVRLELMSTLAGAPLYRAAGFAPLEELEDASGGAPVPLVKMGKPIAASTR